MPDKLPASTGSLHPRNIHQGRYDLAALCKRCPELTAFIKRNPNGEDTVDFSDSQAVLWLNKALLAHHYQIANWQIPEGYLCPPIPGRADYIHYAADLLTTADHPEVPTGKKIMVLDIGVGANCIYPIIGSQSYGWKFVGSDIDPVAISVAEVIAQSNKRLKDSVKLRLQTDPNAVFKGIIQADEYFDLTLCNPPFHASSADAQQANQRKRNRLGKGTQDDAGNNTINLLSKGTKDEAGNNTISLLSKGTKDDSRDSTSSPPSKRTKDDQGDSTASPLNFGGQDSELWCEGGELGFLTRMITESVEFSLQVYCFTSLVSKKENVVPLQKLLTRLGAKKVDVIATSQGQKISRLLAWSFLTDQQRIGWIQQRGF